LVVRGGIPSLSLLAAIGLAAAGPGDWAPVRWPGGPVEAARRGGRTEASVRDWYHPRTLGLLQNTPFNCLLVTWSAGAPADVESEQRERLASYTRAAQARGIAVVGVVYPGADAMAAAASALEAGLDGLAVEGSEAEGLELARELRRALCARNSRAVVIPLGPREWLRSDPAWPIVGTREGLQPRIRTFSETGAAAATPTSAPWIDSNTWLVRSLRAWAGGRPVWLGYRLEDPAASDYERAIADAAVAGGRWVAALDDQLQAGLWREQPEAQATWRRIAATASFFESHREWTALPPAAALGVMQDSSGGGAEAADENLNLIARRQIPYRVVERSALGPRQLEGLPALLATALASPTEEERRLLAAFVRQGGLLVAGPGWAGVGGSGAGRVVVYEQDHPDPDALSRELHDLLGHENLPVRLFNVPSVLAQINAGPRRTPLAVLLVNYATEPAEAITARAAGRYRRARLYRPDAAALDLPVRASGEASEVFVARVTVCAAVVFEK
jgi:hypothetical protein